MADPESRVGRLVVARRVLVVAIVLLVVALVATGAWLWFRYTPASNWISETHRFAAWALMALAAIAVLVAIMDRVHGVAHGVVASVALLAAAACDHVLHLVAVGGRELAPSTYERWSYAHLGLALLVLVAFVLLWLRTHPSMRPGAASPTVSS